MSLTENSVWRSWVIVEVRYSIVSTVLHDYDGGSRFITSFHGIQYTKLYKHPPSFHCLNYCDGI